MFRSTIATFIVLATAGAASAQVESHDHRTQIVVPAAYPVQPPPAPMVERVAPRPGYEWIPGYHDWRNGAYIWIGGRWEVERRGERWIPGRWERGPDRYVWMPGRYERTVVVAPAAMPYPTMPPPEPIAENPEVRPGYVWIPGHHDWRNGAYVWIIGHYEMEQAGRRYFPGRWELAGDRYVWTPGRWEVLAAPPPPMPPPGPAMYPREPPPPPQVEHFRPRGHNWHFIRGHWNWEGRWVWIPGHWEKHHGRHWEEGEWRNHGDHWEWHEGIWRER
jgi:hypothetical protein